MCGDRDDSPYLLAPGSAARLQSPSEQRLLSLTVLHCVLPGIVSAEKKRQAQDKKFMQTAEKDFVALVRLALSALTTTSRDVFSYMALCW